MPINKRELINRIQNIEGLSNEDKSSLIKLLREQKKYGLVWEDKPEDVEEKMNSELPVLKEVKDKAIISDSQDSPNHILIEGDNLHALTALSYTHIGKIDLIYIDPPYNTGNNDFVYNDKYLEADDGYRHSKWLSFIGKRLKIAKRLLSEQGVIFISIDDHEQAQLKLLCDESFGEQNFVGTFFWKRTSTPPALSYKIRKKLEYVLCYQKSSIPQRTFAQGYIDGGDVPLLNSGNPMGTLLFPASTVHFNLPDGIYSSSNKHKIELLDNVEVHKGVNSNGFRAKGNFKWNQTNLQREIDNGTYFLIKSKQFSIRFQRATKTTKVPSNIIDEEVAVGTNEDAQKEIMSFKFSIPFEYAKPTSLIMYLIRMPFWKEKNIIVLDFFAGSGTTLQATMQLNLEDGGKRQCILVTNNENRICEEVTYIRNKKVIEGYTKPNGENVKGLKDNNLRYFKTEFIPREATNKNKRALVSAATDMLCIKNDIYKELSTFCGKKVKKEFIRYFDNGKTKMLIIFDERAVIPVADLIRESKLEGTILIYVFSNSRYAYDEEFIEVADKVTLCALPAAIYDAYKKVIGPVSNSRVFMEDDNLADKKDSQTQQSDRND